MHDCVTCGGACYCHGDIDDCAAETEEYASQHCSGCGCKEDGLQGFADIDDADPQAVESMSSYLQEIEARRRQVELESYGQMRLLP